MRYAFIGHSYHRVTSSSSWFIDILREQGSVDVFWSNSWSGGTDVIPYEALVDYDRIFVFQVELAALQVARIAPAKLVFIPMFDSIVNWRTNDWKALLGVRIISLSWTLHSKLRALGLDSVHFQYFPDPAEYTAVPDSDRNLGYLWARRAEIDWRLVKKLSSGTKWDRFTIHVGIDPVGESFLPPSYSDIRNHNIVFTEFQKEKPSADKLDDSNIYFAPRRYEGIGMSFLEAMARGQCVVAVNAPTMSEYITHQMNGLLYSLASPQPLDFKSRKEIGARARESVFIGHADWVSDLRDRLPQALFGGAGAGWMTRTRGQYEVAKAPLGVDDPASPTAVTALARAAARQHSDLPRVTVAMVVFNAEDVFEETFRSICEQSYSNLEIVVVDGASTDSTTEKIAARASLIDVMISEPDDGCYDAMNKAVRLASGDYIIFMNAGDYFYSRNAIAEALSLAPRDADFIIGHHLFVNSEGIEKLQKAEVFSETWSNLLNGHLSVNWLAGVPCHQSTITRRAVLLEMGGYDTKYDIAGDHDFMYRSAAAGKTFFHCGRILSIYTGGGLSAKRLSSCVEQWWSMASRFGPRDKVDLFFRGGTSSPNEIDPWWSVDFVDSESSAISSYKDVDSYLKKRMQRLARSIRKRLPWRRRFGR